ncbi:MAG: IspD/TarI family cytidylyltransferase [bacterium]|nr:IspD/TarI family cytidylyltransferase [bacterium]
MTASGETRRVVALLPAAGNSTRMRLASGAGSKVSLEISPGLTVLQSALSRLKASNCFSHFVIACRPSESVEIIAQTGEILARDNFEVISGGHSRQESVRLLLEHVRGQAEVVAVHDAARPYPGVEAVMQAVQAAFTRGGAILACPLVSTVKFVEDGKILRTVPRENLYEAHTPQCFRFDLLWRAHEKALIDGYLGTDESELVERLGFAVEVIPSGRENLKITAPSDLSESILDRTRSPR